MFERVEIQVALMLVGLIIGASSMAWWFLIGSAAAVYGSLLVGHVTVWVGFALERSRQRLVVTLLLTLVMWWPAVFGDLLWA
ncbi:MAG: hypothetical protein OXD50_16445 [Chloroflexi bacterium]|nr:hypothetical protein [Chloroflexota bacterium]